ncbi:MAG: Glycosyl transferase, WecB/TagA/CpsF family, partial [Candidatus Levybacteria bacterium GW2011_GWA2_41_15]
AAMGVGGAFDFISGKVHRAPKFVRGLGLEWLFRLAIQPWRIKRQVALIKFTALVIKEKLL